MKNLLNSLLVVSLLMPAVSVFASDVTVAEIADVNVDAYMVNPEAEEHYQEPVVVFAQEANAGFAELDKETQNIFVRGYNATKSAVTSAGSYVAGKARSAGSATKSAVTSAGSYVTGKVKGAGSYVANSRVAGYATAAKNYVASEYNNAKGVKGVSLFAAKAVVGTSVVAGAAYLTYKAAQYAYNKAKSYKAKRQPRRTVVGGLKRVVTPKGK